MNSVTSTALSGLGAAALGIDVAANNIANTSTVGYRRQTVVRQTQAEGGVRVSISEEGSAAPDPADTTPKASASLALDLVVQLVASDAFKANLRAMQVNDQNLGSILDEKA